MAKRKRSQRFVSRGGDKLDGALASLNLEVRDRVAADLGANVGGFTDCLLQRGARRVYAVDTAYGVLDWKLRQNPRVVTMERTNALHVALPELVDLVVIDVGWTPLGLILPRALGLLRQTGGVVALLKPQYEAESAERMQGVVPRDRLPEVVSRTVKALEDSGVSVARQVASAVLGSGGNQEIFLLVHRD